MSQRFRTKIVEIEATQFTGENYQELREWSEGNFREVESVPVGARLEAIKDAEFKGQVYDMLHATWINVLPGQWIVRGVKGEFYPCDDETFFWKYESVDGQQG